jgi:polyketide cyclase/dehydrase/lipid transport protein
MVKRILFSAAAVIAALVVLFVLLASIQPTDFRIARSQEMAAPASAVFAQVNDFHAWEAWSPWAKLDPNATTTFEGPTSGVGASFIWSGNDKVGAGRQTILESRPDELVRIKLDFERPFKDTCDVDFKFEPKQEQTLVVWSMSGKRNFIAKAMSLFIDCDKIVGPDFEKGLVSLKKIVETKREVATASSSEQAVAKSE